MSARARPESGFLLVGVVMFVLALTILGMSLYSLSSYEADFQARSHDANAAFYRAQGGLTMVTQLLQSSWKLDSAQVAVGHQGVDSVYVSQPKAGGGWITTGPMNNNDVTVTVLAHYGTRSRKLIAMYTPSHYESYYTRLFTVAGTVGVDLNTYDDHSGTTPAYQTFSVSSTDSAWTNDPSPSWTNLLAWPSPKLHPFGNVPKPDVASFVLEHPAAGSPGPITPTGAPNFSAVFNRSSGTGIAYYFQPQGTDSNYSYSANAWPYAGSLTLSVSGTAVWILQSGLYSYGKVIVNPIGTGGQPATLVIVASPKADRPLTSQPGFGIYLNGGLSIDPNVNVILVTDGSIYLGQMNDPTTADQALSLSIFCSMLQLMGPRSPTHSDLAYDPAMTPIIANLEASGALPRGLGAVPTGFTFVKGSWRDLTP